MYKTKTEAPKHPAYDDMLPKWEKMRDTVNGEDAIKDAGTAYLHMTSGQQRDGSDGLARYNNYKQRAVYLNFPKGTVKDAMGMLYARQPYVEIPKNLEYLRTNATPKKEGLVSLMENINKQQLIYGRVFVLADIRKDTKEIYYATYPAKSVINWHSLADDQLPDLDYVVLDESGPTFSEADKKYIWEDRLRVLGIFEGVYYSFTTTPDELDVIDFTDLSTLPANAMAPSYNGKTLTEIPGTFINVTHTGPGVEDPPLLDQANIAIAYYRGDADYRLALFKQGQGTFYGTGFTRDEVENQEVRLGADGLIMSSNKVAKVGFAELNGQGLPQMQIAGKDLKTEALALGVTLFDKAGVESGKALETRSMVKTASIRTIALTAAEGLTKLVRIASGWTSTNVGLVEIKPNTDFLDVSAIPQDVQILYNLIGTAGMNLEDYHAYLHANGYTEKPFIEWRELHDSQMDLI